jgi:branched-subunit amino acid aminotransferase/4-amino-4-deoxychorismate lyase
MEVMPVSRVDEQPFRVGEIAKFLRSRYQKEVNAYIAGMKSKGPSLWAENE